MREDYCRSMLSQPISVAGPHRTLLSCADSDLVLSQDEEEDIQTCRGHAGLPVHMRQHNAALERICCPASAMYSRRRKPEAYICM